MKISQESRKALVNEIRFANDKMKNSENPLDKVFYFSAVFGIFFFCIDYSTPNVIQR